MAKGPKLNSKLRRQKWELVVGFFDVRTAVTLPPIEHLIKKRKVTDVLLFDILLGSYHQSDIVYALQIAALTSSQLVSL